MTNKVYLILVCITTVLLALLEVYLNKSVKSKKTIHAFFEYAILSIGITNIGYILMLTLEIFFQYYNTISFVYIIFLGASFFPVFFLLFGLAFAKRDFSFERKYLFLFVIPVLTNIVLWTNSSHNLFYKEYLTSSEYIYGPYFLVHILWLYGCVLIGIGKLLSFSIKNAGFFSKQALLIIAGTVLPLVLDVVWIMGSFLDIEYLKMFSQYDITPITFTFAIICYALAIFKFDFLNVVPIALQRIVDIISDGFIVIDEDFNIIDYNETFLSNFSKIADFKRKDNIIDVLVENNVPGIDSALLAGYLRKAVGNKESVLFEKQIVSSDFNKYFTVEITPIFSEDKKSYNKEKLVERKGKSSLIGIIILLKDITEHKMNLKALKENQEILLEQERLASLGQLIGGIAHNLKTPIMSISGGIEALRDLTFEYRDSIDDKSVTEQDHKEIAREMMSWLDRMKPYCGYMSDVISAVKGQAVQMNASVTSKFTVDELIKRVDLLMKHELKKYHCILKTEMNIDKSTEIKGEITNLVQVFDNIIINAMQAYEGENGSIDLKITRSGDNVEFIFKDQGKGIPKQIADRLFKEMVTTKGKKGTGLGLYMSYSTIKGRFGGNMSFVSKEGHGTTFFISIPCIAYNRQEAE